MRHASSRLAILGTLAAAAAVPLLAARAGIGAPGARAIAGPVSASEAMNIMPAGGALPQRGAFPSAPDQAGISRVVSENWESADVFARGSAWRAFDSLVTQPGLNDQIKWGRRDCKSTVGNFGLWVVGGGTAGEQYPCNTNYPSPLPNRPGGGIRTELQYLYLNFTQVPPEGGLRVTLDYQSRMPGQALFVGAGDFDNRNPDGSIPIRGSNNFVADTQGDWVRGHVVEIRDSQGFVISHKPRVIFAIVYADPPSGQAPPSSGNFGVLLDNVHLDAMIFANPGIIPSPPTPTSTAATPTETPEATNTRPPVTFPTTPPPLESEIQLPFLLKKANVLVRTPVPTAPTATATRTVPPPTPSNTSTPEPSLTPSKTPVPSSTPIPFPDVLFEAIIPLDDPEIVRVKNYGTAPQDMTNWRVFATDNTQNCYFPQGLVLGPGETFAFLSGRNSEPGEDVLVCNESRLIWDNNLDEGQLWNHLNVRVDRWCYDRFGPIPCE
jgi:hypothetical protein